MPAWVSSGCSKTCEPTPPSSPNRLRWQSGSPTRGSSGWTSRSQAKAAHGSRPELGIDAIAKIGPILLGLEQLTRSLGERTHPQLGSGTVHASVISGGTEASTIPEQLCTDHRTTHAAGENIEDVEGEIETLLNACRANDDQLTVNARTVLDRPALETGADEPVVRALASSIEMICGASAEIAFISSLAGRGPVAHAREGAHAEVEWGSIADTVACTKVLVSTAVALSRTWCPANS